MDGSRTRFLIDRPWGVATALFALALLLRAAFATGTDFIALVAGDINDYLAYAWNLHAHGVYSSQPMDAAGIPVADNFRPPGYPAFLLLALKLAGSPGHWLAVATWIQIVIGALTVVLTYLVGRLWLPATAAIAAGVAMALWPHHVVMSTTLLSETLLGFLVLLGIWLRAIALRLHRDSLSAAAGLVFSMAALVNTLVIFYPLVLALACVRRAGARSAAVLVACALAAPLAWSAFGPGDDTSGRSNSGRAIANLVQGAWPQYHAAWRTRERDAISREIMAAIDAEVATTIADPRAGLAEVGGRLASDPAWYARWYLVEKPWLLWDWDIRLGWHGVHFLPVRSSPYERQGVLAASLAVMKALNPVLFAAALLALVGLARKTVTASLKRDHHSAAQPVPAPFLACGLLVLYVTFFRVLLQAEPRYSIPYRPEQMLLACHAFAWLAGWLAGLGRDRRDGARPAASSPSP